MMSYLLLGEFLTAPHLADLMALIVAAGGAVPTVVFTLAADALSTSLAFLLDGLVAVAVFRVERCPGHPAHGVPGHHRVLVASCRRDRRDLARALHAGAAHTVALRRALQAGRAHFPALLLARVQESPGGAAVVVLQAGTLVDARRHGRHEHRLALHYGQQRGLRRVVLPGGHVRVAELVVLPRRTLEQVDVSLVQELLLDGGDLAGLYGSRHERVASRVHVHGGQGVEARQPRGVAG